MNETERWTASQDSPEALAEELERMNDKLDRLMNAVGLLDRRRDDTEQMLADLMPAANGAMRVATRQLWNLERRGTIDLFKETVAALEDASGRIDHDDLRALGENAGRAMHTLRTLTGPDVAVATERTVRALQTARTGKPPGLLALLWKMRSSRVRRGLGAAIRILEALGEGAHPVATASDAPRPRLPSGPSTPAGGPTRPPVTKATSPLTREAATPGAGSTGASTLELDQRSIPLDPDGFLVDPADWSPEVAEALAERAGIGPLTDEHWRVVDFCRSDAEQNGGAPGLRRITKELEIPPKDMYRLFPKGPGTLAARLAGLGKPKSCV